MRRDLRELAVLLAVGLVVGLGHLALRPDMPWVPAPRADATMCDGGAGLSLQPEAAEPLMSSPEEVP